MTSIPRIQGTKITEDYPALFGDSYGTADAYNEPTPFLDAIYHPCQEAAYQGQQVPSSSHVKWPSDYGSGFGNCWGDDLFSYSYCTNGDEFGDNLVKTEDNHHAEEQYDTDFSYNEDIENEAPGFDYNPCYESCSRYIEELFIKDSEQEARPTYSYGLDEMGFCEGIFGYWPCLYREVERQAAYIEQ